LVVISFLSLFLTVSGFLTAVSQTDAIENTSECVEIANTIVSNVNLLIQTHIKESKPLEDRDFYARVVQIITTNYYDSIEKCKSSNLNSLYSLYFDTTLKHYPKDFHTFVIRCSKRIEKVMEIIQNAFVGFTNRQAYDEIFVQNELLRQYFSNMKRENTVCNSLFDQFTKETKTIFKVQEEGRLNKDQCEAIALKFTVEVNQFLNKCEKSAGFADSYVSDLFMSMTATHKEFDSKCVDMTQKFMLPYVEPISLYFYGFDIHVQQHQNAEHPEYTYEDLCRDRIESLFDEFSGSMKVTVKINLDMLVNSVKSKQMQFRAENSICNQISDRVFAHFK